jgi:hypothetical protein
MGQLANIVESVSDGIPITLTPEDFCTVEWVIGQKFRKMPPRVVSYDPFCITMTKAHWLAVVLALRSDANQRLVGLIELQLVG